MSTKEKLLSFFESHRGSYFSGEELAGKLSVSRAAVWKAVRALRDSGYVIDAAPGRGYCLSEDTDILSAGGIRKYLSSACGGMELHVLPSVESTNSFLRKLADAGAPGGYTVIAGAQTAGRGRLGRGFYSPEGTGIYMSLLLRPSGLAPDRAVRITTMAATAACEAIREVSGRPAQIKWVNDIYMDGKKVSGILTEAALGMESNVLEYVVLGIGINVYRPAEGFPAELADTAGAVLPERKRDAKNALAAGFLNHFAALCTSPDPDDYIRKYRSLSLAPGREITVLSPDGERRALALDVDDACRLVVRYEDGREERLSSGEIRIRLL